MDVVGRRAGSVLSGKRIDFRYGGFAGVPGHTDNYSVRTALSVCISKHGSKRIFYFVRTENSIKTLFPHFDYDTGTHLCHI